VKLLFRFLLSYDPVLAIDSLRVPVLALFGTIARQRGSPGLDSCSKTHVVFVPHADTS
jgi:hypothetical protein